MDVKVFIGDELKKLAEPATVAPFSDLTDEIYRLVMSHKFRKYSASDALKKHIRVAIEYNVKNNKPINVTFLGGSFKLWRLEESPEVDWAELFALMYYATWVKGICAIYPPGVHIDFHQDDIIMERICNYTREEVRAFSGSMQKVIDFLKPYIPTNLKFTITPVSGHFKSEEEMWRRVDMEIEKFEKPENLKLTDVEIARIELNYRPVPGVDHTADPLWREKNAVLHDAYCLMSDRKMYRNVHDKIVAMPHHVTVGATGKGTAILMLGSTKNSTMKYWVGAGVLKVCEKRGFAPTIYSVSQLEKYKDSISIYSINVEGLDGKNFGRIKVQK